ncbi:hypothetical protein JCM6882_002680 [Rhodosporidiobolus microsporus]
MSEPSTGACCVCGEGTATRCGSCAEAGFDLFFCSKEHQKLIWPSHKRVCGPRSNPFVWPELTQEEAEEARKFLTHEYSDTRWYKLCVTAAAIAKLDPPDPLALLDWLTSLPPELSAKPTPQLLLAEVRVQQAVVIWANRGSGGAQKKGPLPPADASEADRRSYLIFFNRGWALLRRIVSEQAMPTHPDEAERFLRWLDGKAWRAAEEGA